TASGGEDCEFTASGRTITFHGFLKAYVEGHDDPDGETDDKQTRLPDLAEGDPLTVASLDAAGHETRPPARYTEATLIRELEEREIGRPSTYASIVTTIQNRGYVYKKGTALVPAWVAFATVRLLEGHFGRLVDYEFTASLEAVLDSVAGGRRDRVNVLHGFWFGDEDGDTALKALVEDLGDIDARGISTFEIGEGINARVGRYGPYVEGPPDAEGQPARANIPDDLPPDELTLEKARELLANPTGAERELGLHPETGQKVVAKNGRYGPYVTELLPEDAPTKGKKAVKPRTASLFKSMELETLTLEDAVRLLTLPRVVGVAPAAEGEEEGQEITAQNGRYGPYLKKGTDSRSIDSEEQLLTITLDEALAIYAQPKQRGRRAAAAPLKELGADPVSGGTMLVKDGRFGPYVTDGEVNATLRKGDEPDTLTAERAADLLAEKRAKGPSTKKTARKAPAKKATKKTAAKKAPAKKTAAKKTAAKKTTAKAAAKKS
ncbi:topoisomerase C-terminal repeat-containing protein, partial [Solicola sp. PLA-1-18]|uniref:topoisomerase C-terminal repeat-containing protein n=1 Tax=Solicola sp. PLA-1-18 TaxID=3380532 RepID=UPI003B8085A7